MKAEMTPNKRKGMTGRKIIRVLSGKVAQKLPHMAGADLKRSYELHATKGWRSYRA